MSFTRPLAIMKSPPREAIRFRRCIPGDIFELDDGRLRVTFSDTYSHDDDEEVFDLVSLAVGLCPAASISIDDPLVGLALSEDGFIDLPETAEGIFAAGTATGPMGIEESVASADRAAWSAIEYLNPNFKTAL